MEDPEETLSVNYVYVKKDTKVEETTIVDIITTTYLIKSDTTSAINLDASQVSIQWKIDNKHILSINNMPNTQESKKLY